MTPAQQTALAALVGRALTAGEMSAIEPHLSIRNDVAIAEILSIGRTRHSATQIGTGTIMVVFGERGGAFLDAVEALGQTNRNVYWGFDPVRRGVLDLAIPAGRAQVTALKTEMPDYAVDLDRLLQVGAVADPIHFDAVSRALNTAEGRMML